jgi:hypothetical protein
MAAVPVRTSQLNGYTRGLVELKARGPTILQATGAAGLGRASGRGAGPEQRIRPRVP